MIYIPPSTVVVGTGLSPLEHKFEVAIAKGPRQLPFEQLPSMQSESYVQVTPRPVRRSRSAFGPGIGFRWSRLNLLYRIQAAMVASGIEIVCW